MVIFLDPTPMVRGDGAAASVLVPLVSLHRGKAYLGSINHNGSITP